MHKQAAAAVSARMARVTVRTLIDIPGDFAVRVVHSALVVLMAGEAGIDRVITGIGVALVAGAPCSCVVSGVDREIRSVMIESGRRPARGRVTGYAGRGEMRSLMVGIARVVVIGLMAEITIRRRALKLSIDVAQIARDIDMLPRQRKRGVAVIERRRIPRRGTVARQAIVIELSRHMVRIRHVLIVRLMARIAIRRETLVLAVDMTQITDRVDVRASQRKRGRRVVEGRRIPHAGIVTGQTVVIKLVGHVIRIGHAVKIRLMAGVTVTAGSVERPAAVTGLTGEGAVRTGQREARTVVTEGGRLPGGGRVTMAANPAEVRLHMAGIAGSLKIVPVAGVTVRGRVGKMPVGVATVAE